MVAFYQAGLVSRGEAISSLFKIPLEEAEERATKD
jgi:hypothetical protein